MENGHHTTITEPHLTFVRSLYSLGQPSFVYVMMPNAKAALSDQTMVMFSSGLRLTTVTTWFAQFDIVIEMENTTAWSRKIN